MAGFVIEQFEADIHIWSHQRYSRPTGPVPQGVRGFRALRQWATSSIRESEELVTVPRPNSTGSCAAAALGGVTPQPSPRRTPAANPDKIRVFQVATGNLGTETIGRIQRHP